jgi:hypothetical protein
MTFNRKKPKYILAFPVYTGFGPFIRISPAPYNRKIPKKRTRSIMVINVIKHFKYKNLILQLSDKGVLESMVYC